MELHSATTALTLLRGGAGQTPSPGTVKPDASPFDQGVTFKKAERAEQVRFYGPPTPDGSQSELPEGMKIDIQQMEASRARINAICEKSIRGESGPFDPDLGLVTGQKKGFDYSYRGTPFQYPGAFADTFVDFIGRKSPMGEAKYTERRDAMINAYHYGRGLAEYSRASTAYRHAPTDDTGQMKGISPDGELLEGKFDPIADAGTEQLWHAMRSMEMNAASLAIRFGFDSTSVTTAAYAGEVKGFSISLGAFGKLADFGADGSITLYGSDGTAYAAADYNAANVDGGIPELYNHELIRKDPGVLWRGRDTVTVQRS